MVMYENGINVEMLRWHLKRYKGKQVIIYYEYETPDDDDFDTDIAIHTVTDVVKDGETIRLILELDNGKRMTTDELIKRVSGLNKKLPVKLVKNEQITGVGVGSDDDGFFCFFIENNVLY